MVELLKLDGLSVGYGPIQVIKSLSLHLDQGELIAVLGANGAGKSTLLRTISGVLQPTTGQVVWRGQPIQGWPAHKVAHLGIVHVPEGRGVFPELSVAENLQLGSFARPDNAQEQRPTISLDDVFRLFPALQERLSQRAGTLSGGQQQMVAIGRGLLARPLLLILDEPLLGLAPALGQEVLKSLREIVKLGVTVLLVEQDAGAAMGVADRVYVLSGGEVIAEGTEDIHQAYFRGGAEPAATPTGPLSQTTTGEPPNSVLTVQDVSIRFGGNLALDRVSLEVRDGEIVGLIGPNGAGKSTLINCVSGFLVPNDGQMRVIGRDAHGAAPDKLCKIGLTRTFQNLQLFGTMTVFENVLAAVEVGGARGTARPQEVRRLLDLFDLTPVASSRTASLPYGTRKLVEMARAVATQPKVLLLDEPVAGLNTTEKAHFTLILRRILADRRMSILLVEHDMPTVQALANRVYVLDAGRIIAHGSFEEIAHDPEVIRAYLGEAWQPKESDASQPELGDLVSVISLTQLTTPEAVLQHSETAPQ
jgi:ABC-type branched-subunit amino acid transport system ATPase component